MAVAMVAAAFLRRKILTVKAFRQFLLRRVADGKDLAAEMQRLTGHRVVEVERDALLLHGDDRRVHDAAVLADHRHDPPHLHQVLAEFPADHEGRFRHVEAALLVIRAITLLRAERKGEGVAFRKPFHLRFEAGNQHVRAVDIVQRALLRRAVHDGSVDFQFVGEDGHFVLVYLHLNR